MALRNDIQVALELDAGRGDPWNIEELRLQFARSLTTDSLQLNAQD